ncbi:CPBP family intramembrane glutamic endopeptidase [Anaerotignum sp.]|uniref:CPBP family intramembrane glutamic endopeptidase n=1 Tax=Anaerotignum sp. TaxID=2039241 RepID=UPI003735DCD3
MVRRTNQYFLFVFLFFMLASSLVGLLLTKFVPLPAVWNNIIMQFLVFIPMLVIYVKTEKTSVKECFSIKPLSLKNALICLGIAYCSLPFVSLIVVLTSKIQPNLVEETMNQLKDSSFFSLLLLIAVQPAIFEEMLFRGAALHGYRSLGTKKTILMSALMFAMLHMNLQQALYAFLLGAIFAFLVQRTGSIFASMLPHFLINALNCFTIFEQSPQEGIVEEMTFMKEFLSVGLQCLIFLPFLILLVYLFLRQNPAPAEALPADADAPKEKIFTASFWIIVAIFILLGVLPNLYWK